MHGREAYTQINRPGSITLLVEANPIGFDKYPSEIVRRVDVFVVGIRHFFVSEGVVENALPLVVELVFVVDDDFFFIRYKYRFKISNILF